jgi:hypothetical protein
MRTGWIALGLVIFTAGCAMHSKAYDDAFAACQAEAIEQMEVANPGPDQRSQWQQDYIEGCMDKKGFPAKTM